jgi:hypothetical protein
MATNVAHACSGIITMDVSGASLAADARVHQPTPSSKKTSHFAVSRAQPTRCARSMHRSRSAGRSGSIVGMAGILAAAKGSAIHSPA